MVLGKLDRFVQRNETRPFSYTTHKNKFKWIKDLNVRPQTIKILKEKISSKILDIDYRNFYQLYLPRQGKQRKKKNKLYYIKIKDFCTAKEIINKIKTTHRMRKHISQYI